MRPGEEPVFVVSTDHGLDFSVQQLRGDTSADIVFRVTSLGC